MMPAPSPRATGTSSIVTRRRCAATTGSRSPSPASHGWRTAPPSSSRSAPAPTPRPLTAQWKNLWSDLDRALTTASARATIYQHVNAQYESMMQAQGRVDTLMQTCTGTGA